MGTLLGDARLRYQQRYYCDYILLNFPNVRCTQSKRHTHISCYQQACAPSNGALLNRGEESITTRLLSVV